MERYFLYWHLEGQYMLTNTCTTAPTTKQVARKVLCPPFLVEHIPLPQMTNDLTKRKTRMKEVVKENGYQKNIFKIIKRIINNHSL